MNRQKLLALFSRRKPNYMKPRNISERVDRILAGNSILTESLEGLVGGRLDPHGIEYGIFGGHAVTIHGHPRMTHDIDLLAKPKDWDTIVKLLGGQEVNKLDIPRPSRPIDGVTFESGQAHIDLIWINQPWATDALRQTMASKFGKVIDRPWLVLTKLWSSRGEQDDTDIIQVIKGMDAAQVILTKKLVAKYFQADIDDFDQMVEIAKL